MTASSRLIEVQGTAEGAPFSRTELSSLLDLAESGIKEIVRAQEELVAEPPAPRAR
jgi:ribonuclease PH